MVKLQRQTEQSGWQFGDVYNCRWQSLTVNRGSRISVWLALTLIVTAALGGGTAQAGEYFTEETTSPSLDVVHGWKQTEGQYQISLTNSSRSRLQVPLEVNGKTCTKAAFQLEDSRTLPIGEMKNCTINTFPFLDRLINQQVSALLLNVDGQVLEIRTTPDDRVALAQVANQSREAYLSFQQEVSKAVAYYLDQSGAAATRQAPTSTPASEPGSSATAPTSNTPTSNAASPEPAAEYSPPSTSPTAPSPQSPPQTTAAQPLPTETTAPAPVLNTSDVTAPKNAGQNPELVIVGDIQEQTVGGGSRLTVQARNTSPLSTVLSAQARFEFSRGNEVVETRTSAFDPSDIPPGATATAEVLKTGENWDKVSVSFLWDRPVNQTSQVPAPNNGTTPN